MKYPRSKKLFLVAALAVLLYGGWQNISLPLPAQWSDADITLLQSLSLQSLSALPPDIGNAVADDAAAARFGQQLFFDQRLSGTGTIACASCHRPERMFTDQLPLGIGTAKGDRHTMTLIGAQFSPWHYWDGRKDSLWSQALEPLENPLEHAGNRMQYARLIAGDSTYRQTYESLFGPIPDFSDTARFPEHASPLLSGVAQSAWQTMTAEDQYQVSKLFSNLGKAIAAYERQLLPGPAGFDRYVEQVLLDSRVRQSDSLSGKEIAGLRLFIGKAQCLNCHNGPLLTNNAFHNTGVLSSPGQLPGLGRAQGLRLAQDDPFNCLGVFSDAEADACQELRFAKGGDEMLGAQRTPTLRNVVATAPYMHTGQFQSLAEVVSHYDKAEVAMLGHNEAKRLKLRAVEQRQLESFLHTLDAPLATDTRWLAPP